MLPSCLQAALVSAAWCNLTVTEGLLKAEQDMKDRFPLLSCSSLGTFGLSAAIGYIHRRILWLILTPPL